MVLTRYNIEQIEAMCLELAKWGFVELTFNQLGGNDRPEFYSANRLLIEQVEAFRERLPEVRARMAELGLAIQGSAHYLERIATTTNGLLISIDECWPGSTFLFVDERGRMSPCSFTGELYGIDIGEIQNSHDLDELPARFRTMRLRSHCGACTDCPRRTYSINLIRCPATLFIACLAGVRVFKDFLKRVSKAPTNPKPDESQRVRRRRSLPRPGRLCPKQDASLDGARRKTAAGIFLG